MNVSDVTRTAAKDLLPQASQHQRHESGWNSPRNEKTQEYLTKCVCPPVRSGPVRSVRSVGLYTDVRVSCDLRSQLLLLLLLLLLQVRRLSGALKRPQVAVGRFTPRGFAKSFERPRGVVKIFTGKYSLFEVGRGSPPVSKDATNLVKDTHTPLWPNIFQRKLSPELASPFGPMVFPGTD